MSSCFRARHSMAILFVLALFFPLGCKSVDTLAAGSGSGSDLSGPPVFNARFQAREPRKCSKVASPPSVSQAAALIQCSREQTNAHQDWITQDVKVEMGSPRAFIYQSDAGLPE